MQFRYTASNSVSSGKRAFTAGGAKPRSSPNFSTAAKTFGYREFTEGCSDFMA
jgi:hypothetical protein